MGKNVVAGIDIGGTNTRIGLADDEGNVLLGTCIATDKHPVADMYVEVIYNEIETLLKGGGSEPYGLIGIGIGAPNGNYHTGCIEDAVNLPWQQVPLTAALNRYYPTLPVKLTNDANAVALAEMVYGDAKGLKDFIVVTLGTGLGSGFVANGDIVYGYDGLAGELGHIIAIENGRECNCGRCGCLETYASATGIKRTVFELLCNSAEKNDKSVLRDIDFHNLSAKDIDKAAREGDSIANKAFEITGKILGKCLADMVAVTSSSHIFLFGGLAEARELIFTPTIESLKKNILFCYKNKETGEPKVKILPSGLGNKDTGIIGAAALIWKDK
ncbi:MAG: ROK family protein [Prevotellaceae bacterium]|jgi:glucokinase|nr:ROK family protein [Prevotellaceae bacterium]